MFLAVSLLLMGTLVPGRSWTEDLVVPARVQAELVGKLAAYDRNFMERAGGHVVIAIVAKPSEVDSARGASQIRAALKEVNLIAGLPHEEVMVPWTGARELAQLCAKRNVTIVYLAPGLTGEIGSFAKELEGHNILTVACVLAYVAKGAVLGFELVSGRTKLVINLGQAKKQKVVFRAEVLKLMRIVE
jgi:YfiR/HmsC-like